MMPFTPAFLPLVRLARLVRFTLPLLCAPLVADAQSTPAPADTALAGAVRVFLDCQSARCDYDFFRDQMRWVNWVRDRLVADVQLLVTSLTTGSGGSEYTISAIGLDRFRGRADTAITFIEPAETSDVAPRKLARTFSLLLAPYAARTALAERLTLSYAAPSGAPASPRAVRDPWNFWVYRLGVNGYTSGEKQSRFRYLSLSASANRVTEGWRINLGTNLGYDESRYDLGADGIFLNLQRNYGGNVLIVKSLGEHWSAGATANASYSDYFNHALSARVQGAVEYDFFPYKDFTRRQLTAYYAVGIARFRYNEITLYDRMEETRPVHNATLAWNARQPWGSVNLSLFGSQFLHDTRRYNYGAGGNVSLRIAKGLAFNIGGNYSRVADQLYLPKGQLDDNQIIARQRALATNFRYFGNFGISYTFGSIYNTVVNPRFGGARGEF